MLTNGKKMLQYRGYPFTGPVLKPDGLVRWRCTRRGSYGCNVWIEVNDRLQVVTHHNAHTHAPQRYIRIENGEIIEVSNGNTLLRYKGYTFSNPIAVVRGPTGRANWRCTFRGARQPCKVYLRTDDKLRVEAVFRSHNHPPPNYIRSKTGVYMKGLNYLI
ncbi:hypothetical protein RR48_05208 [Papilio machaon]|uniref:FLYWCH-type domain-containing protein n=1 Tax=Papilio machaon TaxID=76193 RepID=A0A0N1PIQ6_PAPMA|nr:hypothetical protein RR48_05208 [Papilio machaon]